MFFDDCSATVLHVLALMFFLSVCVKVGPFLADTFQRSTSCIWLAFHLFQLLHSSFPVISVCLFPSPFLCAYPLWSRLGGAGRERLFGQHTLSHQRKGQSSEKVGVLWSYIVHTILKPLIRRHNTYPFNHDACFDTIAWSSMSVW